MAGNDKKGLVLQERDRRLLAELCTMRLIDREQAKVVAGFGSTTRANTRLLALTRAGLLHRFFVGSIGAGRKAIYTLSPRAAALLNLERAGLQRKQGQLLVGDLFVEHQMGINEVFLTVKYQPIPVPDTRFRSWLSFFRPLSETVCLVPDGYFELETPAGVRAMFLEVDLGTETLRVWEQKTHSYLSLAISGEFHRLSRQPHFRVLVIAKSTRRLSNIRSVVARQTDKIFYLSSFDFIHRHGLWSPIWLRPSGDRPVALL